MKVFRFLDGSSYEVRDDACRGCFMHSHESELSHLLSPLVQTESVEVRQDAEWPIPGFYIVSLRKHIGTIADVSAPVAAELWRWVYVVRLGMKEVLGIDRAQIYSEEKIVAPHFHVWLLPLWPNVSASSGIYPKIYEANVKDYIDLFRFESEAQRIENCNSLLRGFLKAHSSVE